MCTVSRREIGPESFVKEAPWCRARFLCMLHASSGFLRSGFHVLVPLSHSTATPLTGHYCHGNADRQALLYDLLPYYASSSSEAAS